MKENGLTNEEVKKNREKYGSNALTLNKSNSFFSLLLESLADPIIKILLTALGMKIIFLIKDFDWYETIGIVLSIFVASFISSISEYGSEKEFIKLQEEASKLKCKVKRNGQITEVLIDDIVKNDIVYLESGDFIPADGIIINGSLVLDESSMSGEAKEQIKQIGDKVFRGTTVYHKNAYIKVTEVGDKTTFGKMNLELTEKNIPSPLKLRLRKLALIISKIGYVSAILVSLSYLFNAIVISNGFDLIKIKETIFNFPLLFGHILYALTLSITIIIVAVPEGLPMMITLVLSSNMKRMLKDNVLVRKLVGIETAGSLNILFTDKTGTITHGKLEVVEVMEGNLKSFYSPIEIQKYHKYYDYLKYSFICNNESTISNGNLIGGNITDRALRKFFINEKIDVPILKQTPFDSEKKYSKVTIGGKKNLILIKGAYEKLLPYCNYYYDTDGKQRLWHNKKTIEKEIKKRTQNSIRVLILATSENDNISNLTFVGAVFLKDEIRKEAIEGLKLVKSAGIQTVMITGDAVDTAKAIGREIGLIQNDEGVITSKELSYMTDEEVKKMIPNLKIVARSLPQDKSRLVKLSEDLNLVVGMTGDGVNDAPALKHADVGFAMGSGSSVAKEASDIVILDNNFLSISKAILYGRTIFKSIRKFIICQLTINLCAISLSIIGPFIGIKTPVTVIQMLWVNMVMDTLMGLAFAFEPALLEYMEEPPKKKNENIINGYMFHQIFVTGIYSAILCLLFLKLPFIKNFYTDELHLMSAFFGLFIFIDIFNGFNARTHRMNIFANIFKNKVFIAITLFIIFVQVFLIYFGGTIFRTTHLSFLELEFMIICASSVLIVDLIRKLYLKKKGKNTGV